MRKILFLPIAILFLVSSCKVFRPNLMLNTPKNYNYDKLNDSLTHLDYKLAPTDFLEYRVYTNDGFKLIDMATSTSYMASGQSYRTDMVVNVESDGTVKMPLVGRVKVAGFTIREACVALEERYAEFYVKPFVTLKVVNKRVIVYPGAGGLAQVVTLTNNNTTVIEALAFAGGITDDGKAYKVKLIRNNRDKKPEVYLIDLSRIGGLAAGNTVVLANDIIYVEPRYRFGRTLLNEIAPYIALITTSLLVVTYLKK